MFNKFLKLTKNIPTYESGFRCILILSSNEEAIVLKFSQNNFAHMESWVPKMWLIVKLVEKSLLFESLTLTL